MVPVNYFAVIVAAILQMILGALWYGPLFGAEWAALSGMRADRMGKARAEGAGARYVMQGFGALVMSFTLQHAIIFAGTYLSLRGLGAGIMVALGTWIGFIAPVMASAVLWEGKPWRYWMITAGYYLAGLIVMGILLAIWM